jgi:hypothetical protein
MTPDRQGRVPRLTIFRMKSEGRILAARVFLTSGPDPTFMPGDRYFAEVMKMIGSGIYVADQGRVVLPTEGVDYLRAIESKFSRSSAWIVESEDT